MREGSAPEAKLWLLMGNSQDVKSSRKRRPSYLVAFFGFILLLGSGPINSVHSARTVLRSNKKESCVNVVYFQYFTTRLLCKNASPYGVGMKHPSIEPMTAKREPPLFCHWLFYLNASWQTEYAGLMGSEPKKLSTIIQSVWSGKAFYQEGKFLAAGNFHYRKQV
jgi:hypothetical protein